MYSRTYTKHQHNHRLLTPLTLLEGHRSLGLIWWWSDLVVVWSRERERKKRVREAKRRQRGERKESARTVRSWQILERESVKRENNRKKKNYNCLLERATIKYNFFSFTIATLIRKYTNLLFMIAKIVYQYTLG